MCINKRLLEGYNLTGYSTINHCDAESDDYGYGMPLDIQYFCLDFEMMLKFF